MADHEGDDENIFGITTGRAGIVSRAEATWFTRYHYECAACGNGSEQKSVEPTC